MSGMFRDDQRSIEYHGVSDLGYEYRHRFSNCGNGAGLDIPNSASLDQELFDKVFSLASDSCPDIRNNIFGALHRLHQFQPRLAWQLVEVALVNARNPRVLASPLRYCRPLLRHRFDWLCSQIVALDDQFYSEARQGAMNEDLSD